MGEGTTGMSNVVGQLTTGLTADTLWASVSSVMPFVIGITLFAFGFWLVKKIVKKVRTGKAL